MKIKNQNIKLLLLGIVVACVVSLPVIMPYFNKGYFPTHDGEWAVVRLADMFRTLRDGQFPARFSGALNFGYGYPLFNFAYPFPYYLGVFIHAFKINFVDTVKLLFAVSVPLSSFFMFLLGCKVWKNTWSGIVAAILYVYFPYRMVDLYVRGSIGEALSFVLFPLILYFGIIFLEKKQTVYFCLLSVCTALLIGTHNIMTVLFLPVFLALITVKAFIDNKRQNLLLVIAGIIGGFGLSSFFWIPAIFEKNNILLSVIPIADRSMNFASFADLLFSPFRYGVPGGQNAFTFQLGWGHIIVILSVFLSLLIFNKSIKKPIMILAIAIMGISLVYFFLLFRQSTFIWEITPFLKEINYPWTVLSQIGLLISLLAGFLITLKKPYSYISLIVVIVAIFTVVQNAKPEKFIDRGDEFYITNEATTTSSNELMPLWIKKMPVMHFDRKVEFLNGEGEINNIFYKSNIISFDYNAKSKSTIRINTIYYPGWELFVGKNIRSMLYNNENGVMQFDVDPGKNNVKVKFSETPLRKMANIISIGSFLALFGILIRKIILNKTK